MQYFFLLLQIFNIRGGPCTPLFSCFYGLCIHSHQMLTIFIKHFHNLCTLCKINWLYLFFFSNLFMGIHVTTVTLSNPFFTFPKYLKFVPYFATNLFLKVPGLGILISSCLVSDSWPCLCLCNSIPFNSINPINNKANIILPNNKVSFSPTCTGFPEVNSGKCKFPNIKSMQCIYPICD